MRDKDHSLEILDRMAKINDLILDKALVTIDQWSLKLDQPVTFQINTDFVGIDELTNKVYAGSNDNN